MKIVDDVLKFGDNMFNNNYILYATLILFAIFLVGIVRYAFR